MYVRWLSLHGVLVRRLISELRETSEKLSLCVSVCMGILSMETERAEEIFFCDWTDTREVVYRQELC